VPGLRTVTVLEHEVVPILRANRAGSSDAQVLEVGKFLTEREANSLLDWNERRPGFCQRTSEGIKFANYCGVVGLESLVLEVLPKIGLDEEPRAMDVGIARSVLLRMLHRAQEVRITDLDDVSQDVSRAPLLETFVLSFLNCALSIARRGLMFRYEGLSDDLTIARGRFQIHGHLRRNLSRPHLLHCEFDEFTADNPYNRAIRAALDICRPWLRTSLGQNLWFEIHARFAHVPSTRVLSGTVERLHRDRTTRHYTEVLKWCELLLRMESPDLRNGEKEAPGLLFDMNKLFEAHVLQLEKERAPREDKVKGQGPQRNLALVASSKCFTLKPDVTISRLTGQNGADQVHRIVDAKWKRIDPKSGTLGVDQADIYQLLAYAVSYGCRELELVYPEPDRTIYNRVPIIFSIPSTNLTGPVRIQVRTVHLLRESSFSDRE